MSTVTYRDRQYNLEFQEYYPVFWCSFWCNPTYFKEYRRITGTDIALLYLVRDGEFIGFMQADGPKVLEISIQSHMNRKWMEEEVKLFNSILNQIKHLVEKMRIQKPSPQTRKQLIELYHLSSQLNPHSNGYYILCKAFESKLLQRMTNILGKEKANVLMAQISTPVQENSFVRFTNGINSIANQLKKQKIFTKEAIQSFYSTNMAFRQEMDEFQQQFYYMASLNASARTVESFFPDIEHAIALQRSKMSLIPIPHEVEEDVYLLQSMIYFKDELSTFLGPYLMHALQPHWDWVAQQNGLTFEEMTHLHAMEALGVIPVKDFKKLVLSRKKASFFVHEPPSVETELFDGEKAEKAIHEAMSQVHAIKVDVKEIHGTTGSPGKVRGIVQKILSSKEISKFEKGKILVTVYTAPEFVPAMQKSIAIITDTGGITSHAAIVSRELGKPCVVGTKIATKALNDGDEVEVDADKGIVRKLK